MFEVVVVEKRSLDYALRASLGTTVL